MTSAVETGRTLDHILPNGKSSADGPAWLREIREQARQRFATLGYPTTRLEEWKYTNTAPIARTQFRAGEYKLTDAVVSLIENLTSAVNASSAVFINGKYCAEFSNSEDLPDGMKVNSLSETLQNGSGPLQRHFARDLDKAPAFAAFNTSSFEDGAFVEVPNGLILDRPVHLIFISASNGAPSVSHPRNLLIIGDLAQVSIIETYAGLEGDVYFTNTVTGIVAGESSAVHHYKVQRESDRAFHIATLEFDQARHSSVTCHSFSFGGALVRNDINMRLATGAEGILNGLYLANDKQHVDNHTLIDHAEPHAASRELYKGILDGHAGAVFNGKVIVRKDAQKTDAKQTNRNLLLSEEAVINTKPELQIYADDVRCTHGATIGQLEENALFYLRSRGIGETEARQILIQAFAEEIIEQVKPDDLREVLENQLIAKLKTAGSTIS
jgi:Fe-S cluster assembly protein SufD